MYGSFSSPLHAMAKPVNYTDLDVFVGRLLVDIIESNQDNEDFQNLLGVDSFSDFDFEKTLNDRKAQNLDLHGVLSCKRDSLSLSQATLEDVNGTTGTGKFVYDIYIRLSNQPKAKQRCKRLLDTLTIFLTNSHTKYQDTIHDRPYQSPLSLNQVLRRLEPLQETFNRSNYVTGVLTVRLLITS